MAGDLGELLVSVSADTARIKRDLAEARREITAFSSRSAKSAEMIRGAFGKIFAGFSVAAIATSLYNVNAEFGKLNASLRTVTGSDMGAKAAFKTIEEFATTTPYQLAEVTQAFIRLKGAGLDSSIEALRAYGDTASSMSKDFMQFIEAVTDATMGEFERLKEFNIKASSEGDRVKFTFKGVATEVGKNAEEIEQYLIKLGQVNFADGMKRQMDQVAGSASNMGDSWDKLMRSIGDAGASSAASLAMDTVSESLQTFANSITLASLAVQKKVGFWDWLTAGAEEAKRIVSDELGQLETRVKNLQREKAGNLFWSPYDETELQEALSAVQKYKAAVAEKEQTDKAAADAAANKKAAISDETRRVVDALRFEVEQLGRSSVEQKVNAELRRAGVAATAEAGQQIAAYVRQIEADRIATESANKAKAERNSLIKQESREYDDLSAAIQRASMAILQQETAQLETDIESAAEAFQGFAIGLQSTGGAVGFITEGLRLYNHETDKNITATEEMGTKAATVYDDMKNAVAGWASNFSSTLADMVWGAERSFSDILTAFGKMITQMMIQKSIVEPMLGAFGFGSVTKSAHGNVFAGGRLQAFAQGGIVSRPTLFPMARGAGLMGEAGPEAIMPLKRTASGDLGVVASGTGGNQTIVQVINNSGGQARTERTQQPNGAELVRVIIDAVDGAIGSGRLDKTFGRSFGLARSGVR